VKDRLAELLKEHDLLKGIICRDPTLTDIELLALAGAHVIWIDLEHAPFTHAHAIDLARTIIHLGMVPMARIIDLERSHVQALLDGGFHIILLPGIADDAQARELVRLGKYPPDGQRGVSTSAAGLDFDLGKGDIRRRKLRDANAFTRLAVQFESDSAFDHLDAICAVDGIDLVTVGPADWAISLGLFADEARQLDPKTDRILTTAVKAGRIAAMGVGSPQQAKHYANIGVRILFAGVDLNIKRRAFSDTLNMIGAEL